MLSVIMGREETCCLRYQEIQRHELYSVLLSQQTDGQVTLCDCEGQYFEIAIL